MSEQLEYTEAIVQIFFTPGHVACEFCPLLETYARKQCRRTGEYLTHDTRYGVGRICPIIVVDKSENNE